MKLTLRSLVFLALVCYGAAYSFHKNIRLLPGNIQYYASYLSPSVVVSPQEIRIGPIPGFSSQIEVPIGLIGLESTIAITIGFDKTVFNQYGVTADLIVGITDGTQTTGVWIRDHNDYASVAPCYSTAGQNSLNKVSSTAWFPSTFKLTFDLAQRYSSCETAQDGGYLNLFNNIEEVNFGKPLSLQIISDHSNVAYSIKYINVDVF